MQKTNVVVTVIHGEYMDVNEDKNNFNQKNRAFSVIANLVVKQWSVLIPLRGGLS